MAEPSKHEHDVFDQDEDRGRSQRTDNVKVFNGTYLSREALSGMEARFKAYGDVAADGHDLKVFRRDQQRAAALTHQLNELNQALEHSRREGEPGSRFSVQNEYWRLAAEYSQAMGDLGAREDRVNQLERQLQDHGLEPDPIPEPKPEPRFAALERDRDLARDMVGAQRVSPAPRAAEQQPRPDFQLDQQHDGPRRHGDVHPNEGRKWFNWIRREQDNREGPDRVPPVPESERATWSRPTMRTSEPHLDKKGKIRNVGTAAELVNQQVTLPRIRGLEHDPDGPQATPLRDMGDRSVGEQFMPRDRTDDAPERRRLGPNFGIEPRKKDIEARARRSGDVTAYSLPDQHVYGRQIHEPKSAPDYYNGYGRRGPRR